MNSSKYKNIYQVTPYYPPNLGGLQNCVQEISTRLSESGYNVTVFTSNISYKGNSPLRVNKNLIVHYFKSIEIAHTPIATGLSSQLLKIPKNSLLHIHISNAFFPEITYLISRMRNIKYIVHYHIDVDPSGFFGFLLPLYKSIFLSKIITNAEKIICLTESQRVSVIKKYSVKDHKTIVIPNGVDKIFFNDKEYSATSSPRILYVGRIAKQKNLTRLINAMSILKDKYILDIVGDGDERDLITNLIHKLQLKNIHLHGSHTGNRLVEFYKRADIFVLPSDNEGMSLSLLEAMAAGIPIITTDLPQTRDFLAKGAILVSKPNATKYAEAIDKLLRNRTKMKEMSSYNTKHAKDYSWDTIMNKIDHLYQELT